MSLILVKNRCILNILFVSFQVIELTVMIHCPIYVVNEAAPLFLLGQVHPHTLLKQGNLVK
jgi:hypothetical protein